MISQRKKANAADPWMSVREAASALGINKATVLTRVIAGDLEGQQVAGRVVISRASVERHRAATVPT